MLGSISVTEQVENLSLFYLSKDRNLCSVRSRSSNRWNPYLYFILGQKPVLGLIPVTEQVETLSLFFLKDRGLFNSITVANRARALLIQVS